MGAKRSAEMKEALRLHEAGVNAHAAARKAGALHELIADYRHLAWPEEDQTVEAMRLDLIERALREHSSKTKVLEAERDLLRERERELVEVMRALTQVGTIDGNVVVGPRGWELVQAALKKVKS